MTLSPSFQDQIEEWGLRSESGRRQLSCILELHGALSASHRTHLCQLSSLCGMPLHLVYPSLASAQGWAPAAPALLSWCRGQEPPVSAQGISGDYIPRS